MSRASRACSWRLWYRFPGIRSEDPAFHQCHEAFQPVGFGRGFVGADAGDAGEAHGDTRLVTGRELGRVECNLEDHGLLHLTDRAETCNGVITDPAVEEYQFLIGEAEIGLADRHQFVAAPETKCVVRVVAAALAVAS